MRSVSVPGPLWVHDRFQDRDRFLICSMVDMGS